MRQTRMPTIRATIGRLRKLSAAFLAVTVTAVLLPAQLLPSFAQPLDEYWPKTDFSRRNIDLSEIISGGPPKDGIPAIDKPIFISQNKADKWLNKDEPVIVLTINEETRAYPLQILIYHEIVNDRLGQIPVSVTFCPLCNTSIVFDRRVDNRVLDFGTTGKLRKSDMIMYDRQTESWWQQFLGLGLVGHYMGKTLKQLSSTIVSYEALKSAYPDAMVLSTDTGYTRPYGNNPYQGYDTIGKTPFLYNDPIDARLPAMERVLGIETKNITKIYPLSVIEKSIVLNDTVDDRPIVIFGIGKMYSPLDKSKINTSRKIPSAAAFSRRLDNTILEFVFRDNKIYDTNTNTQWNIFGQGIVGKLKNRSLAAVDSGVHFAFAWLAFKPNSILFRVNKK